MSILTAEQKKAYMEEPWKCPFCGSEEIEYDLLRSQDDMVWQPVGCIECYETWNDIYKHVTVDTPEEIEGGR